MWFGFTNNRWTARGKNVLITGASSGIGAETARNFARNGAALALLARNEEALREVARECLDLGAPRAEVVACDVTDHVRVASAVAEAASRLSDGDGDRLDVVVLSAGRSQGCYFEEIGDAEQVDHMLRVNVNGVVHTILRALPLVPKRADSRVVLIGSVSGRIGVPYRTVYCASKHAVSGFADALRLELSDSYGADAPAVQLINFPEVRNTNLNAGRMDMGAESPPARFIETPDMISVEDACADLYQQIERGTREWGHPFKVTVLRFVMGLAPAFFDSLVVKMVKDSHYRPEPSEQRKSP